MKLYDRIRLAVRTLTKEDPVKVWECLDQQLVVGSNGGRAVLYWKTPGRKPMPQLVVGEHDGRSWNPTLQEGLFDGWRATSFKPYLVKKEDKMKVDPKNMNTIAGMVAYKLAEKQKWSDGDSVPVWENGHGERIFLEEHHGQIRLTWQREHLVVWQVAGLVADGVPSLNLTEPLYVEWASKVKEVKQSNPVKKGQVKRAKRADNIKTSDIRVLSAITHAQWHSVHATVKSQSGSGKYMVYLRFLNDSYHAGQCTCPDNGNGNKCKHILAVQKFVNKS